MSSSKEQSIAGAIKGHLKNMNLPFKNDDTASPWAKAVFTALRDYHRGLRQPENLRHTADPAHVDQVFNSFMRRYGKTLFGAMSKFRKGNQKVPVYNHRGPTADPAQVNLVFRPLRSALLYLSQDLRRKQKQDSPGKPTDSRTLTRNTPSTLARKGNVDTVPPEQVHDLDIRFPEFSKDDLIDDEHSKMGKNPNQRPWFIRYLPGDPRPSSDNSDSIVTYPVIRRICAGDLGGGEWYIHWSQDGYKTWQPLPYNILDRYYTLHHRNGSSQRIYRVLQGGIPGALIQTSEHQSGNSDPITQLTTGLNRKEPLSHDDDAEQGETLGALVDSELQPGNDEPELDTGLNWKEPPNLDDDTKSGSDLSFHPSTPDRSFLSSSTRTSRKRTMSTRDEDGQPQLPASKRISVAQVLPDPGRRLSIVPKFGTKATPRQITVVPCIIDNDGTWFKWPQGKLSSLDVNSLFARLAESYGIEDDPKFVEVEFRFLDLNPEEVAVIRRDNFSDFEQMIARIGREALEKHKHRENNTEFWIGLRLLIGEPTRDTALNM